MEEIEKLRQEFPDLDIRDLGYGANMHTRIGVITIYWKKKHKYCINNVWQPYYDFENLLITLAAHLHVPKKIAAPPPLNEPKKTVEQLMEEFDKQPWQFTNTNRVQDVISHISRKIEFGKKNGMSNSNVSMLLTLNQELMQYL